MGRTLRLALLPLVALLGVVLVTPPTLAGGLPSTPVEDFRGQPVPESFFRGKVVVFFVCGRRSSKQMDGLSRRFGQAWGEDPEVSYLTVIDLRSVPGVFRPLVLGILRAVHRDTVKKVGKLRAEEGHPPDPDLDRRILLVPDWDGAVQEALGVDHADRQVDMALVGRDGRAIGVYGGESGLERLLEAVGRAVGREARR